MKAGSQSVLVVGSKKARGQKIVFALEHTQRSSGSSVGQHACSSLKERPVLTPTTLLEMLQDKYPASIPTAFEEQCNGGGANGITVWCRAGGHVPPVASARSAGLLDFTKLKGVVVTIAGKLLCICCITSVWNGATGAECELSGW